MNKKTNREFVPEYFIWLEMEEQKRRAEELNEMTKKEIKRDKKR